MLEHSIERDHESFCFIVLPDFSLVSIGAAIDVLQIANDLVGRALFSWALYSIDGRKVKASNGVDVDVKGKYAEIKDGTNIIVCAGGAVESGSYGSLISWIRQRSNEGAFIGSICRGAYILGLAGLLDGRICAVHWEDISWFADRFTQSRFTHQIFEMDAKTLSCAGGTAVVDMTLSFIAHRSGPAISNAIADKLVHHRIRDKVETQRTDIMSRWRISHKKLIFAISIMESNLTPPIPTSFIAKKSNMSLRNLQRLFREQLLTSPNLFYQRLRLNKARQMLRMTSIPILTISNLLHFQSSTYFSKRYLITFGLTPSSERQPSKRGNFS